MRIDFAAIRARYSPPADSLFDAIKAAGIKYASHETDLYIPATDQVRELLKQFPTQDSIKSTFRNQVEGGIWYDIPFAYLPAWEAKIQRNAKRITA